MTGSFKENTKMTIGFNFYIKVLIAGKKKVRLQIWDFGESENFNFLLPNYLKGAKGALLMYDVLNKSTLKKIDSWLDSIRSYVGNEIPIFLIGLLPERAEDREVSAEEGMKLAVSKKITDFIECNVKTGENVEETFMKLARLILKKYT